MNNHRLNSLLKAWALLTRRVSDLEERMNAVDARIRARLKEEADARKLPMPNIERKEWEEFQRKRGFH